MQVKVWRETTADAGDLWMSVNLSGVQLKRATSVDEIETLLRECEAWTRGHWCWS